MANKEYTKEELIKMIPSLSPQEYTELQEEIRAKLTTEEVAKVSSLEQMKAASEARLVRLQKAENDLKEGIQGLLLYAMDGFEGAKEELDALRADPKTAYLVKEVEAEMAQRNSNIAEKVGVAREQEKLMPIFKARIDSLKKAYPKYNEPGQDTEMIQISLVAQRFLEKNGNQAVDISSRKILSEILKESNLSRTDEGEIRMLVGAFVGDLERGVVDKKGNLKNPKDLTSSEVMFISHKGDQTQEDLNASRIAREFRQRRPE